MLTSAQNLTSVFRRIFMFYGPNNLFLMSVCLVCVYVNVLTTAHKELLELIETLKIRKGLTGLKE